MTDTAALRKARGAFFTPPELSNFLSDWAVRTPNDLILEPSCGEAAFLLSAGERLATLGGKPPSAEQMQGVDIHAESVAGAETMLQAAGLPADLRVGNFFDEKPGANFDVVIGNPPYVRYQNFTGEDRAKGKRAALAQGVRLDGLASSWAAFVVHASAFLNATGRLALVLPGELLSVNYAGPVRRFLMERFSEVRLVLFEGRVFPGVMEEVVLVLAEGQGHTDHCQLYEAKNADDLRELTPRSWSPSAIEEKWVAALLAPEVAEVYERTTAGETFSPLIEWGETDLGMVTGNNRYFAISQDKARELGLGEKDLLRISPPGSRHLRGLAFSEKTWREMRDQGSRVYLFYPNSDTPSKAARAYIEQGEDSKVQKAYKCRVRTPWWRVPLVSAPDLLLTYMNHDTPRLVANKARARYLNSVHGVTLKKGLRALGTDVLPIAALNSLTLLGSELVGRSYGGGMLKLEPKEADKLPVPSPQTVEAAAPELRALRPQLAKHLRRGELDEVVRLVDRTLLLGHLKLKHTDLELLRKGREMMFSRRVARAGRGA